MSARSILALIYTIDLLEKEEGIDCASVLARHGLERDKLDPSSEIGRDRELLIFTELLPQVDDPLLGFRMGSSFGFAGYGQLAMLFMTSETAFQGFQFGVKYQALTYLYGELALVPGETTTDLELHPIPLPPEVSRTLIDRDMVGTFKLVNDIQTQLNLSLKPVEVWMPYPRPDHAPVLEEYFGCPIRFDQPYSKAVIRNEDMAIRLPGYNKMAQDMYRDQCDAMLARREAPSEDLANRVTSYLGLFARTLPTAEQVAQAFSIPERSFRRQLSKEGRPFQGIVDQVREEKAKRYLADSSRSVAEIAELLGYSESAAFVRAFERWTGVTPARHRKGS
ncbi:MAG: AraC family transcriptional regulator ligand-binding domain-containing protein [Pseudomonadota bacterium]|uniref:AraC family transcriptional regulator n=1 Tax=Alcanivorax sp. TaxID=1872427 RepID=UPI0025C68AAA|nr:AraC family transcriptional regulator [Alcanivorax sp.]MEE3319155.1 AraC family transcriptional regulator ligand-binding domain-containing protein [Pseudomonadota bacterium]